jgi:hypothetical protein
MSNQTGNNFQSSNPISILGVDGLCVRMAKQVMREEFKGSTTVEKRMDQLKPFCQDVCEALRTGNYEKQYQSPSGSSTSIAKLLAKAVMKKHADLTSDQLDKILTDIVSDAKEIIKTGVMPSQTKSHAFASSSGNFGYYVKEAARRINKVAEMKGYSEAQKIQLATKVFSDVPNEVNNQIGKMKKFADLLSDDEIDVEFADVDDTPKKEVSLTSLENKVKKSYRTPQGKR